MLRTDSPAEWSSAECELQHSVSCARVPFVFHFSGNRATALIPSSPSSVKMKTVLTTFRKTGIVECSESHNEPALVKVKQRTYRLHLLLPRRPTSDPGNKECEMTFSMWRAIKILQQVLYLKWACSGAEACKFVVNNAYFLESCCCASVLWIFNLSALFNLERFLNGFSCLHSSRQQFALLPPLI